MCIRDSPPPASPYTSHNPADPPPPSVRDSAKEGQAPTAAVEQEAMTDGRAAEAQWAHARGSAWYRAATAHADKAAPMQQEEAGNSTRATAGMVHLTAPTRCVRRDDVEVRGMEDTDGAHAATHAPPEDRHAR
eukprot:5419255-Pleurochrysis_carterae.AAC.1